MNMFPLGRSDIFLDIVDYDQRCSGLPGNVVQFIVHLDGTPHPHRLSEALAHSMCDEFHGLFLENSLLRSRSWRISLSHVKRPFKIHHHQISENESIESVLDRIINSPFDLSVPPPFRLDMLESPNRACICLTWHHLLTDARGGEMLFRCLTGSGTGRSGPLAPLAGGSEESKGIMASLRQARQFKPMVRRMKEIGVKSPGTGAIATGRLSGSFKLRSRYKRFTSEMSADISVAARRIHPIFGETAALMAASLRAVHALMDEEERRVGGYIVPVPLSTRQVAAVLNEEWRPGNRVSICFIPVKAEEVEKNGFASLAALIAGEFRQQVAAGLPEAAEAAMDVARFFPKALYRKILRDTMDGQLCSFFFSNTGPVCVGGVAGEPFNVAGARAVSCFHRPMVSQPPGIGFFFSTYSSALHLTTCWIEGALPEQAAIMAEEMIKDELRNMGKA